MKRSSSINYSILRATILISIVFLFTQCNSGSNENLETKPTFELEKAEWLIGNWQAVEDSGFSVETWTRINDSIFSGISFLVEADDTTIIERLSLKQKGDSLYYSAIVTGHNDGLPISFVVTQLSDSNFVIENQTHDFPKVIVYNKKPVDSLIAIVSGAHEGKEVKIRIPMKKVR